MADRSGHSHDEVEPDDVELATVSAALDDEGPAPTALSDRGAVFADQIEQLRSEVRVTVAEPPPDFTDSVLADLETSQPVVSSRSFPWRPFLGAAAAFFVGVVASAAFLLDRDLDSSEVAAADISQELLRAQAGLSRLDATLTIVERGVHPDVPERRYTGTLTYRSPEQLAIRMVDTTAYPGDRWVPNDVVVVVDDGVAWRTRPLGCPVDGLPECLGPTDVDAIVGRAPFSPGWAAPLDLVVPAGDLIEDDVEAVIADGRVRVTTTVRASQSLVEAVLATGAFRQVHATDGVSIELDADTFGLRSLEITASDGPARRLWATTWGYDDPVGATVLRLDLTPGESPAEFPATPPVPPSIDAGFRVGPVAASLTPSELPDAMTVHRSGFQSLPEGRVDEIASWSDGRAWLTVRASPRDGLQPATTAEPVAADNGVVHVDRVDGQVEVFTTDRRYRVSGSLSIAEMIDVAASLPVTGEAATTGAPAVPSGALVPPQIRSIDLRGDQLTIVTDAGGGAATASPITISQRPGQLLAPPPKTDVVEVGVRGTVGRHSEALGTLTWVESGWVVEMRSRTADIEDLLATAATLQAAP